MSDMNPRPADLKGITTEEVKTGGSQDDDLPFETQSKKIVTPFGDISVTVQGDLKKPIIVTYHDIGVNHQSCFQGFFSYHGSRALVDHVCLVHIDAPGQEAGAEQFPSSYVYPTLDQLAEQIEVVRDHFGIKRFIGFGVGVGGNILLRYSIAHEEYVSGLILVGTNAYKSGWIEWAYFKAAVTQLRWSSIVSRFSQDALLQTYFSPKTLTDNIDLISLFREYFTKKVNPFNLSLFIHAANTRTDIMGKLSKDFKPHLLLAAGHHSYHVDWVEAMNGTVNPSRTSYLKIWDCANHIQEERPDKLLESIVLFLQGLGVGTNATINLNKLSRKLSKHDQ